MNQISTENVIELDYPVVSIGKNLSGRIFDAFLFFVLGIVLLIPTLFGIQGNKTYQSWMTKQEEYRLSSHLYQKNEEGKILVLGKYYDEEEELTMNEKSQRIDEALNFFFTDYLKEEFSDDGKQRYLDLKKECKTEAGGAMFSEEGKRILISSDYDAVYYTAYCSLVKDKSLGYLNLKGDYLSLKKKTSLTYLIGIPLTFVLSYLVIYYVIPLCFSRGKQTLGMKITKTALLAADGLSCRAGRFTLRFLFKLFIILIGSAAAFLIPLAVSITMIVVLKSHQSLSEYVTATYLVSVDEHSVYKDVTEYRLAHLDINRNNCMEKLH